METHYIEIYKAVSANSEMFTSHSKKSLPAGCSKPSGRPAKSLELILYKTITDKRNCFAITLLCYHYL